ncbi:MAG: PEP-utilizing enzyme, partial [Gemmatimonadaceae bacterium]
PQDIEWALHDGRLVLLQSRPITSLATLADPDGAIAVWDNSNIVESYGGVTTPLTYTFARMVYEAVYRQFCRMLAVPEARIAAHAATFRCMIGLVRGRVYYNLSNWYRALALLPGYALNRGFMEQMMGVKEPLPPALADALAASAAPDAGTLTRRQRWRARGEVARSVAALAGAHRRLGRDVPAFHRRLDDALAGPAVPLHAMRADQLVAHYRDLEQRLLLHWDAPLVNDFFAMIHFGLLGRLCGAWLGDRDGTLHNDLVSGAGDIVSAEPARRLEAMAALARPHPLVVSALAGGTNSDAERALATVPALADAVAAYLERFGDRCLEELKLETETLVDDPLALHRAIGRLAAAPERARTTDVAASPRALAEARVREALGGAGPRAWIFGWVLARARARLRDRENLRFERTRLFGRVRRIFIELGRRYAAAGLLDSPRDVFYLELDELLGAVDATTSSDALGALAAVRRDAFAGYAASAAPDDRFATHGLALAGQSYRGEATAAHQPPGDDTPDDDTRTGTGCYPGAVTGRARVVRDPRDAELHPGEILVAERTDPGWVMLFPAAAALLVERGSLLSHSAIVARELGLPAVVGVPGLTAWLRTGDLVAMDGRTGRVTRLERAGEDGG